MNPESKRNFEIRSKFVAYLRRYLDGLGFMEVETPVLSPIAGGANARPFITHHNAQDIDMYMRIATELHLKRLIVGGMERVYEVGRIFRNEGMDTKHNPEFTTCELYQAFTNLDGMMDILEGILSGAAKEILGTYHVQWLGHEIDLTPSWQRVTMADAVKNVTGADFMACVGDADKGVELAKSVGVDMDGVPHTWGNALYETFDQKVEETLIQPTFITMYPVEVSPLAKRSPEQPAAHRAVRDVHLRLRDGQRLLRAQRPHRPVRALQGTGRKARQRRRGGRHDGRGLRHGAGVRHAPHGRFGLRHRPVRA